MRIAKPELGGVSTSRDRATTFTTVRKLPFIMFNGAGLSPRCAVERGRSGGVAGSFDVPELRLGEVASDRAGSAVATGSNQQHAAATARRSRCAWPPTAPAGQLGPSRSPAP